MHKKNSFSRGGVENERLEIARIFLTGRLENYETVSWAIQTNDEVIRSAISEIVEQSLFKRIQEPWLQSWRLILQSWKEGSMHLNEQSTLIYSIKQRIESGEESLDLINSIVDLVKPKIKISRTTKSSEGKAPKSIEDILNISLSNGFVINIDALDISTLKSEKLLIALAERSGSALDERLGLSKFINIDPWLRWGYSDIRRIVRPTVSNGKVHSAGDSDIYSEGLAGLARLHFETIKAISKIDLVQAKSLAELCLKKSESYIYLRIWAAIAFDKSIVDFITVFGFLDNLEDDIFWDTHAYPEVSELMARRFHEMDREQQKFLLSRISNGAPKSMFKKSTPKEIDEYQTISASRELKRLVIGGASLDTSSLKLISLGEELFPPLRKMDAIDYDFNDVQLQTWGHDVMVPEYDGLASIDRLKRLQKDLLITRSGFEADISQAARSWISSPLNFARLAADFSMVNDVNLYCEVLKIFLSSHRPPNPGDLARNSIELTEECSKIFHRLILLGDSCLEKNIKDICSWCNQWRVTLIEEPLFVEFWKKLLNFAIAQVKGEAIPGEELNLSTQISSNSEDHHDLEVYGSSVSDLVSIFFEMCSSAEKKFPGAFKSDEVITSLRDDLILVSGRPGLMIKHRFIEYASHFYSQDPDWTSTNLLKLLTVENAETAALWRAISRNRLTSKVIKLIGSNAASKVCDQSLSKSSRSNLAWSLVVELVNSFFESRPSEISATNVQQMLRMADDEVRSHVIKIIEKFIIEVSISNPAHTKYGIYELVGKPFFKEVWPQERLLVTPSISKSLASLPIVISEHLDEIVADISRFLRPFGAWSMQDYGVGYLEINQDSIGSIKTENDVIGLVELLSLTIDDQDGAVIPYDLSLMLGHMAQVFPKIKKSTKFVRLLTIARRR